MSSIVQIIPLQEILLETNNFDKKYLIASGGFGNVYKVESKKHGIIAVKRLDGVHGQGDHEFKTEISLLSKYEHKNIAPLVGFCDEGGEKILVSKYESNGSLDKHLSKSDLTWIQRLQICLDAARGLKYLHDDVGPQKRIIHRDVKSANILLDDNWNAKVSDFGLSKIAPANKQSTFLMANPCGTLGYIDPDYLINGYLTKESDVFSFGIVLFEVLCGRLAIVTKYKDKRQSLYVWVRLHYKRQTLDKIIHSAIQDQINEASLLTFSKIAYQCLMGGQQRPTMKEVVQKLQKALDNQRVSCSSRIRFYILFNYLFI